MKQRPQLRSITLTKLRLSDSTPARVWRYLLDHPGATDTEIRGAVEGVTFTSYRPLLRGGWVVRAGRGGKQDPFRHFASNDGKPPDEPLGKRLASIRRELTAIAREAHEARSTGLAGPMGRALADIEKRVSQVRDQLVVGKQ